MPKFFSIATLSFSFFIITSSIVSAGEIFGPFNLDGGKIACNDDRGPEIKKYQAYKAPSDRFFKEESINVREISGWGAAGHSCAISNMKKRMIKVKTEVEEVEIPVVTEFTVYAHADCGSGVLNNIGGQTAAVECEVSASMVKYTNQ